MTLTMRSRSEIYIKLGIVLIVCPCKFGRNEANGSLNIAFIVKISYIYLSPPVTLKIKSRSAKSIQLLKLVTMIFQCKFEENPPLVQ